MKVAGKVPCSKLNRGWKVAGKVWQGKLGNIEVDMPLNGDRDKLQDNALTVAYWPLSPPVTPWKFRPKLYYI